MRIKGMHKPMFWKGIIKSYIKSKKAREIGWINLNFKPHMKQWKSIFKYFLNKGHGPRLHQS